MKTLDFRPAASRFHTDIGWLDSWHSFSFGHHYDRNNTGHGLLVVSNDDKVAAGQGFGTHGHTDMEIVTWVISGQLEHRDSEGNHGVLYPGLAQRMSAGTGIMHSEMNPSPDTPVHFVQMWVVPDTQGIKPSYEQLDINSSLNGGTLVPIASGQGHNSAISFHQRGAVLWGGRLSPGATAELPDSPFVHLFVPIGTVSIEQLDEPVGDGDALRAANAGARRLTAGADGAEVLIWATN
jgi:quercetin 2,3-dioxygenase